MSAARERFVTLGRVSGAFGVKGWLKVHSYTEPVTNIASYGPWTLRLRGNEQVFTVTDGRAHSGSVVVKLATIDDRDGALAWAGADIVVPRSQLPRLSSNEYYWADLEGLRVETLTGTVLGRVERVLATGGNDVLAVRGDAERLVPFVMGQVVHAVDLERGVILVDWSADF